MLPEFSGKEKQVLVTLADSQKAAEVTLISTVRASTLGAYRKQWKRISRHLPGTTLLSSCTRERIQRVINGLAGEGLAASTVRAAITALHRAMAPAIDAGVVNVAVFQRLALPRMVVKSKLVLSREQRDRLLNLAETRGRDLHLLLALGLLAGLRRSEILAITWTDVDIENCTLVVRNGVHFTTKSGKNRVVPMCQRLREILCGYQPEKCGKVFVVAPERGYRKKRVRWDFSKRFHNLKKAAGVPELTVHGMRRAFATMSVQSGVSIWKVKSWLGHASVQVTERYTADLTAFDADVEKVG